MAVVLESASIKSLWIDSQILKQNPLGDPARRHVMVYLPPGYDASKKYPTLLALAGFAGSGEGYFNFDPMAENIAQRMDRMIASGATAPAIIVAPNCFTRVGGCQYINSSAVGHYQDFLVQELVPWIETQFSVSRWGVFGRSSGGYGAWNLALAHPQVFQAVANHAGDGVFELCYLPDFGAALDAFKRAGGVKAWYESYWRDISQKRKKYFKPLTVLGMAAHYSPNPDSPDMGIDFPFCLKTGKFRPEIWERWRAWDPLNLLERNKANAKKLKGIWVDCGSNDEYGLHWAARALTARLNELQIAHIYEEFDDGHMSTAYRFDKSLPFLIKALSV